jgi:hypothetical protein
MENFKKESLIFKDRAFLQSFILSVVFIAISLVVNYFAGLYANKMASSSVTDIFLSNIPVFDVDIFFIYGPVLFWFFIFLISIEYTKRIPFLIYSVGLFIIIRAIFVSLTHLGPFPTQSIVTNINMISRFSVGNDFFFSGHTGLPFLMALIFWDIKPVRNICIMSSLFFGIIVLLGHYHYSIDVLSAFFITYSIYKIAEFSFKKEKKFFQV